MSHDRPTGRDGLPDLLLRPRFLDEALAYRHPAGKGVGDNHELTPVASHQLDSPTPLRLLRRRLPFKVGPARRRRHRTRGGNRHHSRQTLRRQVESMTCHAFITDGKLDQLSQRATRAMGFRVPESPAATQALPRVPDELTSNDSSHYLQRTATKSNRAPSPRPLRLAQLGQKLHPHTAAAEVPTFRSRHRDWPDRAHLIWVDEDHRVAYAAQRFLPSSTRSRPSTDRERVAHLVPPG